MTTGLSLLGAATAAVVVAAAPALAEGGPRPAEVSAMARAMKEAGCKVDAANQASVLKSAGLDTARAAAVLDVLVREGRAKARGADTYVLEDCQG
ncbi:hypothetical protein [Acidimangrovimonas sediminis]|uniref:hypothetical protein n=1 Tax=Acidimangrovimonas sediminis TaxID=2056283 RepID=UPI000C808B89|nr:hypothetical protein [Acidimangrovimonas sediminis]